jgi:hypothetical protein
MRYDAYGIIHTHRRQCAYIDGGIFIDHTQCSSEKSKRYETKPSHLFIRVSMVICTFWILCCKARV